jgi:hypothetical protein
MKKLTTIIICLLFIFTTSAAVSGADNTDKEASCGIETQCEYFSAFYDHPEGDKPKD